jgi:NCS1 family nucleobase:cation symporter-1
MLRAFVACGWFGIQTWIGGLALNTLLIALWPAWNNLAAGIWIAFAIFWLVQVWIIIHGLEGIKKLEGWSAPLLLAGGVALLGWAVRRGGGLGHVLDQSVRLQSGNASFWRLFTAALTANVGYWATPSLNIPDFARFARSQRSQALGQALGLPATMTAFAFIGVAVTSATLVVFGEAIWNPVDLIARIGSAPVIVFGALIVMLAQLTTNMAANVVSPANDFSSLAPRRINYVTGGLITATIGIVMMPWKLYADAAAYIFTWLIGYSSLMGAIGGVLIADYWVLRRRELSLADLFKRHGRYAYDNGVNRVAMIALALAILPVVPGFVRAATTPGGQVARPTLLDRSTPFLVRHLRARLYDLPGPEPRPQSASHDHLGNGQRIGYTGGRDAHDAGRFPAPRAESHRHARRLRARRVRRLHGAHRRRERPRVPHACGAMRRTGGRHGRVARRRRQAQYFAAGVPGPSRPAMRLLHAGLPDDAHRIPARQPEPHPARDPRRVSGNLCRCTGYQHIVEAVTCACKDALP